MSLKNKKKCADRKAGERLIIQEYEKAQQKKERAICKNCGGIAILFCADCGKVSTGRLIKLDG